MRRNFGNQRNSNNSSNFQRRDRRDDRNDRFNNNDNYRKPMNRSFDRNSSSDYKKPRRDYDDSRNSYQDRRNDYQHREGGMRSDRYNDRSSGSANFGRRDDHSRDRSFNRHHSPPRSRDNSRGFRDDRDASSSRRGRMSPPPRPSIKSRLNPPLRSSIRSAGNSLGRARMARATGTSRILRRNDLRSGLIAKRTAPVNRAKDYAKKIRQARLKLSERSGSANKSESGRSSSRKSEDKTPKKEAEGESSRKQENDNEEVDYLAIANDVNFDEDENESTSGLKAKVSDEKSKEQSESDKKDEPSTSKDEKRHHRSSSKEINYKCVHCDMHLSSAQDYRNHLTRRTHLLAMRGVALKIRMTLNHLRKVQRDRQLEIEARIKDVEKITSKYCIICKLNFRQSKEEHRESEDHKKIRNFLKPNCKICHMQLPSPMKYEMHRCQLDHMRRKQRKTDGSDDDEIDLQELDIGDFKTVDSVGDVDDEKNEQDEIGMDTDAPETENEDPASQLPGKDFISKIEVNYCSLCREYLSRRLSDEKSIADHCKSKLHQKYFNQRMRDDKKAKSSKEASDGKAVKSPEKSSSTSKQNGSEEEKSEKKIDASKDEIKEEGKEETSKFNRYDEKNDE